MTLFVTSSLAVFEAEDTGKISASDKITFENQNKKKKNGNKRHKAPSKIFLEWNSQLSKAS